MLRLASRTALIVGASLRFQAAAADPAVANAGGSPGMRWRGRRFRSTWNLPRFEIHDVRDEPAKGTMTRVAVDDKQLLISQYPQLGPRKVDPNDVTPQFDRDRRISVRMRHMDLAALVAVVEGRVPKHHMKNNAYDLVFEKTSEGYALKGTVRRAASTMSEEWAIEFNSQFATTMEHFLESALTESFGFGKYRDFQQREQERQNSRGNNSGNASNTNNNNRNRRNNNNNNNGGGGYRRAIQ